MANTQSSEKKISRTKKKINRLYNALEEQTEKEMEAWQQVKKANAGIKSDSSEKIIQSKKKQIRSGDETRLTAVVTKGRISRNIMRMKGKLVKYEDRLRKASEKEKVKS
jgi:hypothetical protein